MAKRGFFRVKKGGMNGMSEIGEERGRSISRGEHRGKNESRRSRGMWGKGIGMKGTALIPIPSPFHRVIVS